MNTGEVLIAAAQRIRTQGLCKGNFSDDRGGLCALGAIDAVLDLDAIEATGDPKAISAAFVRSMEAENALNEILPVPGVVKWNDAKEQTAENVAVGLEYAGLVCLEAHRVVNQGA